MSMNARETLETSMWARLRAWLFGYDIFISHKREEALGYAIAIQEVFENKDLACFRDVSEIPTGGKLKPVIERALRRSKMLIVIGTPRAVDRTEGKWVRWEFDYYRGKRPDAPVVVINVDSTMENADWSEAKAYNWLDEEATALNPPEPSSFVIDSILNARKFPRVNRLVRWSVGATGLVLLSLLLATVGSISTTKEQRRIAGALELAANADAFRESGGAALEDSARLAVQAVREYQGLTTDRALRATAELLPGLRASIESPCGVEHAVISLDKKFLAVGRNSDVCIINVEDGEVLDLGLNANTALISQETWVKSLSFQPGERLLVLHGVFLADTTTLSFYSSDDWSKVDSDITIPGRAVALKPTSGGGSYLVGTSVGEILVGDMPSKTTTKLREAENTDEMNQVRRMEFAMQDNLLIVELDSGLEVWVDWNTPTPEKIWQRPSPGSVSGTPFVREVGGQRLFYAQESGIEVISLSDFAVLEKLAIPKVKYLELTAAGVLIAQTSDKTIHTWHAPVDGFFQLSLEGISGEFPFGGEIATMNDGEFVLATRNQGGASMFSTAAGMELARYYFDGTLWHAFEIAQTGELITASNNHIRIWSDVLRDRGGFHLHGSWNLAAETNRRIARW